jgi:hypothetical protein
MVASFEDRKATFAVGAALIILPLVGILALAEDVSENRARRELRAAVAQSSGVAIEGRAVQDPAPVLAALQRVTHVPAHHSSPTTRVHLELTGGPRPVAVTLARDSENPAEFWVYRPGRNWHNDPLGQDAGRLVSRDLDAYLRRRGL